MDYKDYFLKENPFPVDAVLNPYSSNPKINGTIFAEEARQETIKNFEGMFVRDPHFEDRERIGWLWAKGDIAIGRGMGKTALLVYFKHKINKDWGYSYTEDKSKKLCAIYISSREIKDYLLEHMSLLGLRSCIDDNIYSEIEHSASFSELKKAGVNQAFAKHIALGTIEEYLASFRKDRQIKHPIPRPPRDTLLLTKAPEFFLNQTILALRAAGFIGGFLFVDDIENFTDIPGYKHLEVFAKDFGNAFLRGAFAQATERFLTVTLTTHQTSAYKFASAWRASGLASAYPIEVGGPTSVEVPKPDIESCREIVKAYLDYYRLPGSSPPLPFYPFADKSVDAAISANQLHPRKFLSSMHRIASLALRDEKKVITPTYVRKVLKIEEPPKPEIPKPEEI